MPINQNQLIHKITFLKQGSWWYLCVDGRKQQKYFVYAMKDTPYDMEVYYVHNWITLGGLQLRYKTVFDAKSALAQLYNLHVEAQEET